MVQKNPHVNIDMIPGIIKDGILQLEKLNPLKNFLSNLNLRECNIRNSDIQFFRDFKNLAYLDLSGCKALTDEGLKFLAPLVNLKHLDLSLCAGLTDVGLKFLATLVNVKYLYLSYCPNLSLAAVNSLRKALPKTTVVYYVLLNTKVIS
jgi:Leucine-rich repeat (LRR) protein